MNVQSHAFATALTSIDFPVPGGPNIIQAFGGTMLSYLKIYGCFIGNSMASIKSCFAESYPPTSA